MVEARSWRCAVSAGWGRLGSPAILGLTPSTVHRVLTRHGCRGWPGWTGPPGRSIRRYERARPGELVHVDVKKLGAIRARRRLAGAGPRQPRTRDELARPTGRLRLRPRAIDDHTRLAYAEIHPDEKRRRPAPSSCAGPQPGSPTHGITIERVMTDNALAYRRSRAWRDALDEIGAEPAFTRRYRPQTNGKAERFNRTMLEEWAYAQPFDSGDRTRQPPCQAGSTPTTTTAATPRSAATHRSAASTTSRGTTSSRSTAAGRSAGRLLGRVDAGLARPGDDVVGKRRGRAAA